MEGQPDRSTGVRDVWKLAAAVLAVVAIVKELSKPKDEREWHGTVAGFIPYDFRIPTPARIKDVYWNPDGRVIGARLFGVGWAPNFGALAKLVGIGVEPDPTDEEPTDFVVE